MEINKNKNKRKGKTLPSRSIVVWVIWGHPMMLDHPYILANFSFLPFGHATYPCQL
jgi:hypothetical protein